MRIMNALCMLFVCAASACSQQQPNVPAKPATPAVDTKPAPTPVQEAPSASPVPTSRVDEAFVVSTNEPFWNARVAGGTVLLKGMEVERTLDVDANEATPEGRRVTAHDDEGSLTIRVIDEPCEDSMSGARFPYTGRIAFDEGGEIMGCARRASDPPAGEPQH